MNGNRVEGIVDLQLNQGGTDALVDEASRHANEEGCPDVDVRARRRDGNQAGQQGVVRLG
eukprot:1800334-Prorocentrum_lima.AAC.1